ncbi:hypothetical protein CK203_024970 [Vitis vinifera]|uniref:Uncharacterized protein n=1 Tax=Vitis vinifera TaxID=29760 RepID=A0A438J717_VITVI|nr:hypothetical protein CK203_024970 [Vitis vinifera]
MITLRSGKEVELPTPKPHDETKSEKETEKRGNQKRRRSSRRKEDHDSTVNEDPEKIVINEDCKSLVKYKDPGCPTISVMIGGKLVEKALLDLGASVNLLPYSVYKQLRLGELKPTSITLSLADRSVKIPRGMIEDVLVQVDISTIQWILLFLIRTQLSKETNYVPIILGRPFLATSNAIINYRNGLMQLTFGNMTLELNIFYMCKKQSIRKKKKVQKRDLDEGLPEPSDLLATLHLGGEEECLLEVLRRCKKAIGWQISDLKDSPWVSPTQVVPKKSGITVVKNDKGKEVATRLTSGYHFYYFLDGYSGYFQIEIDVEDQEKTTFTCPFGTYAYRRMPFGLCNAPATFQHDLVLNWEKCHFMVHQGIVLGHIISKKGIEVDKAKVELIVKLPSPTVKGMSKDFEQLKQFLTTAPIVRAPNWQLPFEVMCDASDFAIGVVLGQREMESPM